MERKILMGIGIISILILLYSWGYNNGVEITREDFALGKCWTKGNDVICIQKIYDQK